MSEKGYQGWANYATWNVALYLANEEALYRLVRDTTCSYDELVEQLREVGSIETGDQVAWNDTGISREEMDKCLAEMRE